jgi:hypothetical protein
MSLLLRKNASFENKIRFLFRISILLGMIKQTRKIKHQRRIRVKQSYKLKKNVALILYPKTKKSVLMVMTPLPDHLMSVFYAAFFECLRRVGWVSEAYSIAIESVRQALVAVSDKRLELIEKMLRGAFCLVGPKAIKLSLVEIGKSQLHAKMDTALGSVHFEKDVNYLNPDEK